jgi:hypothetical protein
MTRFASIAVAGSVLAGPAMSQDVTACDWRDAASAIVEPWEANSRTFANGDVRVALLDMVEPGLAPLHVLVLSPPYDELGLRQCRMVSLQGESGFAGADFALLDASYDPSVGLSFRLPVQFSDEGVMKGASLRFTLNQSTGAMAAQFVL